MSLQGAVVPAASLSAEDRAEMATLLERYFLATSREAFERDLAEKDWAIVLRDATGAIRGFTTLMRLRAEVDGEWVTAFFSGDTIVDRDRWGQQELQRLWARHVFALAAKERTRTFWFLISGGHKTYRYLSTFFREFYPSHRRSAPGNARRIVDALARAKFGGAYDDERGVVSLASPLRPGVADPSPRERADPDVAFFLAANPGWHLGEELACLTELRPENLTPAGRRTLGLD
jgi:hypothetical protein